MLLGLPSGTFVGACFPRRSDGHVGRDLGCAQHVPLGLSSLGPAVPDADPAASLSLGCYPEGTECFHMCEGRHTGSQQCGHFSSHTASPV